MYLLSLFFPNFDATLSRSFGTCVSNKLSAIIFLFFLNVKTFFNYQNPCTLGAFSDSIDSPSSLAPIFKPRFRQSRRANFCWPYLTKATFFIKINSVPYCLIFINVASSPSINYLTVPIPLVYMERLSLLC